MQILISGGSGFVGKALSLRFQRDGHRVEVLSRHPEAQVGPMDTHFVGWDELDAAVERADVIYQLAGENLFGKRWSGAQKERLRKSRLSSTQPIVLSLGRPNLAPKTFISASAVGYYGHLVEEPCGEDAPAGDDFLAQLCSDWEKTAEGATGDGHRVLQLRLGVVLALADGALATMLPIFRMGLGGKLGHGRQPFAWIHLEDAVEALLFCAQSDLEDAVNIVAPQGVSNAQFTEKLARAIGRPAVFRVPATALKLALGEVSSVLLGGQAAVPSKLQSKEFKFRFETLDAAFADLFTQEGLELKDVQGDIPGGGVRAHRLSSRLNLRAAQADVWRFFSTPKNLPALSPSNMKLVAAPSYPKAGDEARLSLLVGPIKVPWIAHYLEVEGPDFFKDEQRRGPFSLFLHRHSFSPSKEGTWVDDQVHYRLPFGILGRVLNRFVAGEMLLDTFRHRALMLRLRFGGN